MKCDNHELQRYRDFPNQGRDIHELVHVAHSDGGGHEVLGIRTQPGGHNARHQPLSALQAAELRGAGRGEQYAVGPGVAVGDDAVGDSGRWRG